MNLAQQYTQQAKTLRSGGMSFEAIADRLNISVSTAYRAAVATGRPSKIKHISNTKTEAAIESSAQLMRKQGITYAAIAVELGIPTSTAWRLCNREKAREHFRDSAKRYRSRGKTAIADIKPNQLWYAMNQI